MVKKVEAKKLPRKTLFDSIQGDKDKNLYCTRNDLSNEASVEEFFVFRLLKDLGYKDSQIAPKKSISEVAVPLGRKKINYKPDYILLSGGQPRWILDAKATTESLDDWVDQCSSYCLLLNRRLEDKPARFFMLTNGLVTRVYQWDKQAPILELNFEDFQLGNVKYERLQNLLSAKAIAQAKAAQDVEPLDFRFERPPLDRVLRIFSDCHTYIWKADKRSPSSAFWEFVKVMFVKLWADRELRKDETIKALLQSGNKLPKAAILFSVHWIESMEKEIPNPIDEIRFRHLRDSIEEEISRKRKKRVFEKDEPINLRPQTIKEVVRRLEHYDMFGIDEDLNGRLFETFLNATMRGRELGQFFTPRSIVKLMTRLAHLQADREEMSYVIDACCGSGGFLIEALTDMRNKIRNNSSLSLKEKEKLSDQLSNEHLYGIDAGVDPQIARIARTNMYLHGDGGSRIYFADSLDKEILSDETEKREVRLNREELKKAIEDGLAFDIALTNPPFAMRYELTNSGEARILKQYELAKVDHTSGKLRPSLRSSAMFIERYYDLLRPGGILLTIIDDNILAGKDYGFVRDFIRKHFLIRAVISLPGDAFQRSGARVKTSVLYLQKKEYMEDEQPAAFMDFSVNLGVDDLTVRASATDIREAHEKANEEIERIVTDFDKYLKGETGPWLVPPDRMTGRLDAKYCLPLQGRFVKKWKEKGFDVKPLSSFVEERSEEVIPKLNPDKEFWLLCVQYDGECVVSETRKGQDLKYTRMKYVREWDLVFSNIGAVMGSIGLVPRDIDGCVVSSEYTVLRCKSKIDAVYLWIVLRSSELRADLLSTTSGISRHRLKWPKFGEVMVPLVSDEERKQIYQDFVQAKELQKRAQQSRQQILSSINEKLDVESEASKQRFLASKPPR